MWLLKEFWRIDRTYTLGYTIGFVFSVWSLVNKDIDFFTLSLLICYISFNELRYKYDNKN